jgi:DNA-binding response OmpR family regulator
VAQPHDKTILVVDDEADVRRYLSMALEDAGFEVLTATDGDEGLQIMDEHDVDLVSLDLIMPRKSGVKFYREMQTNKAWSKIPVLVVTGHARDDLGKADLRELTMSGPGVYIEKPVKPENYVAAVKKLLGLETTADEDTAARQSQLQNELKDIIDAADAETLEQLKKLLNRSDK